MKVTLLRHTVDAENILIFTKSTRLNMRPSLMKEIRELPYKEKLEQLEYMANTIPSSWEFVDYTFLVEGVSRAYTHQQVRTRAASYAQQSMRVNKMADFDFVMPDRIAENEEAVRAVDQLLDHIKIAYRYLNETLGLPAEDARSILPTNIATNIVCKFNLRTFVDLAKSRLGGRTQSEYQKVVNAMVDQVLLVHPWVEKFLFADDGRDYFNEIESFAEREFGGDLIKKGELLKIVDKMRKG